jgi:F-type H+-transporting ATPase subunit b
MEHSVLELNWSTFVLEIINFLVLVWILKRFLYKPVLDMIARRRAGIEKTLADAEALHADAEKLQDQYEGRLADWGRERQRASEALARELVAERVRKMGDLQTSLNQEREKAQVAEARRQTDARRKIEQTALVQGAHFATRLLEQASGPETEARLVELVITGLTRLSPEKIAALRNSYERMPETVLVVSAFPLADDYRKRLKQTLSTILSQNISLRFEQNSKLLAGLSITIGSWIVGANIQDELKGFIELAHEE